MEIKLNLRLQTLINMITFLENLEMETVAIIVVSVLMTPLIICSLWSLGIAVMCQLFWLGVKAGLVLMFVCSAYLTFMRLSNWQPSLGAEGLIERGDVVKCTMLDVVLSILFQAGFRIPAPIWDRLMRGVVGVKRNAADRRMMPKEPYRPLRLDIAADTKKESASTATEEEDWSVVMDAFGASGDHLLAHSDEEIIKNMLSQYNVLDTLATDPVATVTGSPAIPRSRRRGGVRKSSRNK